MPETETHHIAGRLTRRATRARDAGAHPAHAAHAGKRRRAPGSGRFDRFDERRRHGGETQLAVQRERGRVVIEHRQPDLAHTQFPRIVLERLQHARRPSLTAKGRLDFEIVDEERPMRTFGDDAVPQVAEHGAVGRFAQCQQHLIVGQQPIGQQRIDTRERACVGFVGRALAGFDQIPRIAARGALAVFAKFRLGHRTHLQHAAPVRRNGPLSQCSGRYGIARIGIRLPTSGGSNAGDSPAAFDAGLARGRLRLESNGWKTGGERARQRQRQRQRQRYDTTRHGSDHDLTNRNGRQSPSFDADRSAPSRTPVRCRPDGLPCATAHAWMRWNICSRRSLAAIRRAAGTIAARDRLRRQDVGVAPRRRDKLRIAMSLPTKFAGSVAQFVDISATLTLGAGRGIAAPAFLARHAIPRSRPRPASIAAKRQRRQRSGGRRFTVDAARAAARSPAAGRSTDIGVTAGHARAARRNTSVIRRRQRNGRGRASAAPTPSGDRPASLAAIMPADRGGYGHRRRLGATRHARAHAGSAIPPHHAPSPRRRLRRRQRSAADQADLRDVRLAHPLHLGMAGLVRIVGVERQMRRREKIFNLLKQREDEAHLRLLSANVQGFPLE
ncbi:hypothetical protein BURPS1710b_A1752 [Burkholderia pseudomallei 1710b]|uniref:Uncharacterized protein n=1 Tax=Burkholderia pseudomallei (strain 1710b) TaxID=320372 RepID=Q3JHP5_BURP1|nr:hypothetical protein BURPS1710b_A1752 [Burkholderia pseudomallei 1710b]